MRRERSAGTKRRVAHLRRTKFNIFMRTLPLQNRNSFLYVIVGALVVVVVGLGAYIYNEKQKEDTVQLKIGEQGVSIEKK